mmetsp:Transcript_71114/g.126046  ORF Transcript_71114/g.126046 Transcript_71114/m.126046 type:complete len:780 (+) Transcript_71114:81-2420(+)
MHKISLVLTGFTVFLGLGRRMRTWQGIQQSLKEELPNALPHEQTSAEDKHKRAKALATVLLIHNPAASFNPPMVHMPLINTPLCAQAAEARSAALTMGVPSFFRWLTTSYPQINGELLQGRDTEEWVDNFYLDMNGIIHGCTHGDQMDKKAKTMRGMVNTMLNYTERLIKIVEPRKVVYLAIDGVAPRAKMNQQRMRRYRAARSLEIAQRKAKEGVAVDTAETFNSNCITPGTIFLQEVGKCYEDWIQDKMANDPFFQNGPTIIFSGSDVIGEGEHKIMDFIRRGQRSGEFNNETRHCMYGLDADLIFLSLCTHAPKFCLLRERQKFQKGRYAPRRADGSIARSPGKFGAQDSNDFIWLEIETLRRIVETTMRPSMALEFLYNNESFHKNLTDLADQQDFESLVAVDRENAKLFVGERLVDDFVFMCMLIGNDFLPGLGNLKINEGAIDDMVKVYSRIIATNGYLVDKRTINMKAFERFMAELSEGEHKVYDRKRRELVQTRKLQMKSPISPFNNTREYKREHYLNKFGLHPADRQRRQNLNQYFLEGLSWCLAYYHDGCCSWEWYYPDFYAPVGSDLQNLSQYEIRIEKGKPFQPLVQLLSVLPPYSSDLLPPEYGKLMTSPTSPVIDAYPSSFQLDFDGHQHDWEAVALLPFIDAPRLLKAVKAIDDSGILTEAERKRNVLGSDLYFTLRSTDPMPAAMDGSTRVSAAVSRYKSMMQAKKTSQKTSVKKAGVKKIAKTSNAKAATATSKASKKVSKKASESDSVASVGATKKVVKKR